MSPSLNFNKCVKCEGQSHLILASSLASVRAVSSLSAAIVAGLAFTLVPANNNSEPAPSKIRNDMASGPPQFASNGRGRPYAPSLLVDDKHTREGQICNRHCSFIIFILEFIKGDP